MSSEDGRKERRMEVVYSRCCGLDVHKDTVVACVMIREGTKVVKDIRTFGTMTADPLPILWTV